MKKFINMGFIGVKKSRKLFFGTSHKKWAVKSRYL